MCEHIEVNLPKYGQRMLLLHSRLFLYKAVVAQIQIAEDVREDMCLANHRFHLLTSLLGPEMTKPLLLMLFCCSLLGGLLFFASVACFFSFIFLTVSSIRFLFLSSSFSVKLPHEGMSISQINTTLNLTLLTLAATLRSALLHRLSDRPRTVRYCKQKET